MNIGGIYPQQLQLTFQIINQIRFETNHVCQVIEFNCLADSNISSIVWNKINIHGLLIRNMQIMHPGYQLQMIPIIVDASSYIPKCLNLYMKDLGFNDKKIKIHVNKMQCIVFSDTNAIWKTFLSFKY